MKEIYCTTRDEYGLKAYGILAPLEKLYTLFGHGLRHLLFGAFESLFKSLQANGSHNKKVCQKLIFIKLCMMDKEGRNHLIASKIRW